MRALGALGRRSRFSSISLSLPPSLSPTSPLTFFYHALTLSLAGILTQPSPSELTKQGKSYIPASYIKFFEMSGARVVPIFHNDNAATIRALYALLPLLFLLSITLLI